jgi:hypothetical protein
MTCKHFACPGKNRRGNQSGKTSRMLRNCNLFLFACSMLDLQVDGMKGTWEWTCIHEKCNAWNNADSWGCYDKTIRWGDENWLAMVQANLLWHSSSVPSPSQWGDEGALEGKGAIAGPSLLNHPCFSLYSNQCLADQNWRSTCKLQRTCSPVFKSWLIAMMPCQGFCYCGTRCL